MKALKITLWMLFLLLVQNKVYSVNTELNDQINRDFQDQLMMKLIMATPGDTIKLPAGTYYLDTQLTLTVDKVTIQGEGKNKTILSFKHQKEGAEGLLITSNDITLKDFAIEDTKGDALKINGSKNVKIQSIRTEWTNGPHTENGAYGIYPVLCENVLVEDSVAIGASDAGIYVGQSKDIIVRNNLAQFNVAGIEIENSHRADVYGNTVTNNTGGILVFSLPDLSIQGKQTRVFANHIYSNNLANFAPSQNTVADVPAGTGIMLMANKEVEVFGNQIYDHQTVNVLINSYIITGRPINDTTYDPYAEKIYVYNNIIYNGGHNPQGGSSEMTQNLIMILRDVIKVPFPDLFFDGAIKSNISNEMVTPCFENNGNVDFINIDALNEFENMTRDISKYTCSYNKLPAVQLP